MIEEYYSPKDIFRYTSRILRRSDLDSKLKCRMFFSSKSAFTESDPIFYFIFQSADFDLSSKFYADLFEKNRTTYGSHFYREETISGQNYGRIGFSIRLNEQKIYPLFFSPDGFIQEPQKELAMSLLDCNFFIRNKLVSDDLGTKAFVKMRWIYEYKKNVEVFLNKI